MTLVICDHNRVCDNKYCGLKKPTMDTIVTGANCGHLRTTVNIVRVELLSEDNPNRLFGRKKHEL